MEYFLYDQLQRKKLRSSLGQNQLLSITVVLATSSNALVTSSDALITRKRGPISFLLLVSPRSCAPPRAPASRAEPSKPGKVKSRCLRVWLEREK